MEKFPNFSSFASASFIFILLISGCATTNPESDNLLEYIQARKEFANAVASAVAKESLAYRLVPIVGPVYPPGWVVDANNPADPIENEACLIPDGKLPEIPWAGVEFEDNLEKKIEFEASLPETINKYISEIISVSPSFESNQTMVYSWKNVKQKLPTQSDFQAVLASDKCQNAIKNYDALFIRGIVTLEETFESSTKLLSNVEIKFFKEDGVKFLYDDNGNFKLTDAGPVPYFHIVAVLPAGSDVRGGVGVDIEQLLEAPNTQQINQFSTELK